jgi:hypothetical protein
MLVQLARHRLTVLLASVHHVVGQAVPAPDGSPARPAGGSRDGGARTLPGAAPHVVGFMAVALLALLGLAAPSPATGGTGAMSGLHVSGNMILNGANQQVQMRGSIALALSMDASRATGPMDRWARKAK